MVVWIQIVQLVEVNHSRGCNVSLKLLFSRLSASIGYVSVSRCFVYQSWKMHLFENVKCPPKTKKGALWRLQTCCNLGYAINTRLEITYILERPTSKFLTRLVLSLSFFFLFISFISSFSLEINRIATWSTARGIKFTFSPSCSLKQLPLCGTSEWVPFVPLIPACFLS